MIKFCSVIKHNSKENVCYSYMEAQLISVFNKELKLFESEVNKFQNNTSYDITKMYPKTNRNMDFKFKSLESKIERVMKKKVKQEKVNIYQTLVDIVPNALPLKQQTELHMGVVKLNDGGVFLLSSFKLLTSSENQPKMKSLMASNSRMVLYSGGGRRESVSGGRRESRDTSDISLRFMIPHILLLILASYNTAYTPRNNYGNMQHSYVNKVISGPSRQLMGVGNNSHFMSHIGSKMAGYEGGMFLAKALAYHGMHPLTAVTAVGIYEVIGVTIASGKVVMNVHNKVLEEADALSVVFEECLAIVPESMAKIMVALNDKYENFSDKFNVIYHGVEKILSKFKSLLKEFFGSLAKLIKKLTRVLNNSLPKMVKKAFNKPLGDVKLMLCKSSNFAWFSNSKLNNKLYKLLGCDKLNMGKVSKTGCSLDKGCFINGKKINSNQINTFKGMLNMHGSAAVNRALFRPLKKLRQTRTQIKEENLRKASQKTQKRRENLRTKRMQGMRRAMPSRPR